jgi:hypothetical protein
VARAKQKEINKLTCSSCGEEKIPTDYYTSNSPFHKHTGKQSVCKKCFWEFINGNVDKLKIALRMIDKAFLNELLKSSLEEAEKNGKDPIKIYMKNISMPQYKTHTWDDSDFEGFKPSKSISTKKQMIDDVEEDIEIDKDDIKFMKSFWGKGYELDDLIWLQSEYEDWTNRYECDSKGMETLIQEICKQQLDINIRRANGEKVDQQLKTLQDLLGSSNLKPVQETGANAVEQESFGTLLKKYENEKPVPEADPRWKDVDGISKYIKVFFLGHLSRMLGINNQYADEYWDEMDRYTVEEPVEDEEDGEEINDLT